MKRLVLFSLLCVLFIQPMRAQQSYALPSPEEIKAANDSILAEAYRLYIHEKVAWILEDIIYQSYEEALNNIDGWIPIEEDEVTVKGVFYNKERSKALYEATINIQTGEASSSDSVRDLTADEFEKIEVRQKVLNAVRTLESIPSCPEGCSFNIEAIQIDDNLYRVYWMLGTSQSGIIPFGSDFSYDCDAEGSIKEVRQYHKSYIPTPTSMDGGQVSLIVHSHTSICPYISPTDIALFLLYGYESAGLTKFMVLSTALKCYFVFDAESYEISVEER